MTEAQEHIARQAKAASEFASVADITHTEMVRHLNQGKTQKALEVVTDPKYTRAEAQEARDKNITDATKYATEYAAAGEAQDLISDFLEGKATTTQHDEIRQQVFNALKDTPLHRDKLAAGIGNADVQTYIDTILFNPTYEKFLRTTFAETDKFEVKTPETAAEQEAIKQAEAAVEEARLEHKNKGDELADVRGQLYESMPDPNNPSTWTKKSEYSDLPDLRLRRVELTQANNVYESKITNAQSVIDARVQDKQVYLNRVTNPDQTRLDAFDLAIQQAQDNLINIKQTPPQEVKDYRQLEHLESLVRSERSLGQEVLQLNNNLQTAQRELTRVQGALTGTETQQKSQIDQYVETLNNVFGQASAEWSNEQLQDLLQAGRDLLQENEVLLKDRHGEILLTTLENQLYKTVKVGVGRFLAHRHKDMLGVQETNANNLFDLVDKQGPDAAIVELMKNEINPVTNQQYGKKGVLDLLRTKPEFRKAAREAVIDNLYVAKQLSPTGLTPEERLKLTRYPEGKAAVTKAAQELATNQSLRDRVDKTLEQNRLGHVKDPEERIRKAIQLDPLILMMILGNTFGQLAAEEE